MPNPLNPIFRQPRESSQQRPKGLTRGGKLRFASKKRAVQLKEYSVVRKEILSERPVCEVFLKEMKIMLADCEQTPDGRWFCEKLQCYVPEATDIHHLNSRIGKKLTERKNLIAVGRVNHELIHGSPSWARKRGYLQ